MDIYKSKFVYAEVFWIQYLHCVCVIPYSGNKLNLKEENNAYPKAHIDCDLHSWYIGLDNFKIIIVARS